MTLGKLRTKVSSLLCLYCRKPIDDLLESGEADVLIDMRLRLKQLPRFSFHKRCDRTDGPITSSHTTPPGLEELEKRNWRGPK